MHFIEDDEGVLLKEISAVDQSLQEDTISDEDNPIMGVDAGSHADLIANHISLRHLGIHNGEEIEHCQPPRLHTHDLPLS